MSTSVAVFACPSSLVCTFCGTGFSAAAFQYACQLESTIQTSCNNGGCPNRGVLIQITIPTIQATVVGS